MNFNIPLSQVVGTFTDSYVPNSYRTKYDIAMNQRFCCSDSKESYIYIVNSTSEPIKRQIIFNSNIPPEDNIIFDGSGRQVKNIDNNNFSITVTNKSQTITYYNDIQIVMNATNGITFRFEIKNGIPSESLISVGNKKCFYITQKGNTTYIDYDMCCYQG